jgi:hypothetical protein
VPPPLPTACGCCRCAGTLQEGVDAGGDVTTPKATPFGAMPPVILNPLLLLLLLLPRLAPLAVLAANELVRCVLPPVFRRPRGLPLVLLWLDVAIRVVELPLSKVDSAASPLLNPEEISPARLPSVLLVVDKVSGSWTPSKPSLDGLPPKKNVAADGPLIPLIVSSPWYLVCTRVRDGGASVLRWRRCKNV